MTSRWLDATAQAELVRRGEASPAELVDEAIARIEQLDPAINAVVSERFEKARREARGPLPDGPFRGVPLLLKDLDVCSAGDPLYCGTRFLKALDYRAPEDSHLVEKFRAAGFLILGKTNTPEFGLTVTTEPKSVGPCRNPWNPEHSTGGSSGGSAAAVAAGMVSIAHASDGGGSIRIPASACGLVGLKPSRGRISLGPELAEYWTGLVTSHVVSRSVRDTAAVLDAVCGAMPGDPYTAPSTPGTYLEQCRRPANRLRIGLLAHVPSGHSVVHPDCVEAVGRAGALLESLGHSVELAHPEALADGEALAIFNTIVTSWVAASLADWERKIGRPITHEDVEPATWLFAELGRAVPVAHYINTLHDLNRYRRRMAAWWARGFDVLVTPTLGCPPPKLGELVPPDDNPMAAMARTLEVMPFTPAFNLTGQPALTLPLHWNAAGLPIGTQFVADYGREDLLLRLAAQLEQAAPWAERRPPIALREA